HVPDRDTPHVVYGRMRYPKIPSDVYYLSRKDWDANDDGVYGKWDDDRKEIEYTHPKASIGRIPVRTPADVKAYTEKVIGYESKYPTKSFARKMVYTCPVPHAYPKLGTSQKEVAAVWNEEKVEPFFANHKDKKLTPENWKSLLNDRGAGKLHMHGHGHLPVWVLDRHKTVDSRAVGDLKNVNAYPVITTVSCFTGHFDAKQDPSITESMIRKDAGGAIAIIAPARHGIPIFANPRDMAKMATGTMDGTTMLLTDFWKAGLKDNLTIGEAVAAAKQKMSKAASEHSGYHFVLCELNLLGDPSLDIRSADPVNLKVKAPKSIPTGTSVVNVATGKPGMTVCLWKGDEAYATAVTDKDGTANLTVAPTSAGKMLLTVTGPNANTYTGQIAVK
ncbi:MAG: C25 family cysteine peptidase, partial [Pirellulales bacterium]|nr:C25 family cysteine peptidase [Pirellulales bacterium]